MKRRCLPLCSIIALILCVLSLTIMACQTKQTERIPITTSSELAREYFLKADELSGCYRMNEARQYYHKAIKEDPDFALAYCMLALIEPSTEEVFDKLETADDLSQLYKNSAPRQSKLGLSLSGILTDNASANMINEASKRINRVSKGEHLWIKGHKAMLAHDQKTYYECMSNLVNVFPNDERSHCLMGYYHWRYREYEKAIECFRRATELNPKDVMAFNMLGYNYVNLNNFDAAEQAFKQCIALTPEEPNSFDSYAELLLRMGRHEESIANYQTALSLDSTFLNARTGIAANLNFLKRHTEARTHLEWPSDTTLRVEERRLLLLSKTISYLDEGDIPHCIEALEARYALAMENGAFFEAALDLDAIGRILLEAGDVEAAASEFEQAKETIARSALPALVIKYYDDFFTVRTMCYVTVNRRDFATVDSFITNLKSLAQSSTDEELQTTIHRCSALRAMAAQDYAAAVAELEQSKLDEPVMDYRLAAAYELSGDLAKARKAYESLANTRLLNSIGLAIARPKAVAALERLTTG